MNTILVTDFGEDTDPCEMYLMPAEVTEKYVEAAYYSGGDVSHRRQANMTSRVHIYLLTENLKNGQQIGMQIMQEGHTGQEFFFLLAQKDAFEQIAKGDDGFTLSDELKQELGL